MKDLPLELLIEISGFLPFFSLKLILLCTRFRDESRKDNYWKGVINHEFFKFTHPDYPLEGEVTTLKTIYYLLLVFTQPVSSKLYNSESKKATEKLDTFLAGRSGQAVNNFLCAYYIKGKSLIMAEDYKKAYELLKIVAETKLPISASAKKMMAYAHAKMVGNDEHYQSLLSSAFEVEPDIVTAEQLGNFFAVQLKHTDDVELQESHRQSAKQWYYRALDLYERDEDQKKSFPGHFKNEAYIDVRNRLGTLLVRGTREHFDFLTRNRQYGFIISNWQLFNEQGVITTSVEELHEQWLAEMREAKTGSGVKRICAGSLLTMYQLYYIPDYEPLFSWLDDFEIIALKEECLLECGRGSIHSTFRVFGNSQISKTTSTLKPPTL